MAWLYVPSKFLASALTGLWLPNLLKQTNAKALLALWPRIFITQKNAAVLLSIMRQKIDFTQTFRNASTGKAWLLEGWKIY